MQKLSKLLLLFITVTFFSGTVKAETSPFYFLRISESARAAGLAGCFVSMPEDPSALVYNPATVSTVKDKNFSATFLKHVLDINSGLVTYVRKFEKYGMFAGAVSYTNYGSFDYADAYGNRNGSTFGANNLAFSLTYSNELDSNLYYGVSAKYIFANIEKANSSALALDAGLFYQIPDKRVNIGLSVLNVGAQISKFGGVSESLPLDVRLGINHRLRGLPLLVNFSFHHLSDKTNNFFDKFLNFSLGGELYIGKYLQARLGYDNNIRRLTSPDNNKQFSGFTAGLGVQLKDFNIDYGAVQIGSTALLHRFSLSLDL